MKEIKLSQKKKSKYPNLIALVDDKNFDFINQWNWYAVKIGKHFYAKTARKINGEYEDIYMHQLILNTPKGLRSDHRDHNGLNNQEYNLRISTATQNNKNSSSRINSSSRYLGVFWSKGTLKWAAQIKINKQAKHLGLFKNETDAALAYNEAAKIHHGEFANLNIIYCNPCIVKDVNLLKVA